MALLETAINQVGGIFQGGLNYKYSKKLQEAQNAFTLDMWNRTNEYNSPKNVAARLREGGYNPALAVNGGQLSTPAQSVSGSSAPSFQGFQGMSTAGSDFINAKVNEANIDLLSKQAANLGIKNHQDLVDTYIKIHTAADEIKKRHGDARYADALAEQTENLAKQSGIDLEVSERTKENRIEQVEIDTESKRIRNEMSKFELSKQEELYIVNICEEVARIRLLHAQEKLSFSEASAALINASANAKNAASNAKVADSTSRNLDSKTEYQKGVNASANAHGYYYETGKANYDLGKAGIDNSTFNTILNGTVSAALGAVLTMGGYVLTKSPMFKPKPIKGFRP